MKRITAITLTLAFLLLLPATTFADAEKKDWFGMWAMNHDGHPGTLNITDTKVDCAGPLWCDMAVRYVDNRGMKFTGRIEKIDNNGQHMVFYINFPGNTKSLMPSSLAGTRANWPEPPIGEGALLASLRPGDKRRRTKSIFTDGPTTELVEIQGVHRCLLVTIPPSSLTEIPPRTAPR